MEKKERIHNPQLTEEAKIKRKTMTREEKHIWYDFLRSYPLRFLRKRIIYNHIVDFYCHSAKLIIEIDESTNKTDEEKERDRIMSEYMKERGLTVLRISASDINKNFDRVCDYINQYIQTLLGAESEDVW